MSHNGWIGRYSRYSVLAPFANTESVLALRYSFQNAGTQQGKQQGRGSSTPGGAADQLGQLSGSNSHRTAVPTAQPSQPHSCRSRTAVAAAQPLQPHSRTAAQPHSRTAAQPHNSQSRTTVAAAQPHSRTAAQQSQPHNRGSRTTGQQHHNAITRLSPHVTN
jgi:hypothetical protein